MYHPSSDSISITSSPCSSCARALARSRIVIEGSFGTRYPYELRQGGRPLLGEPDGAKGLHRELFGGIRPVGLRGVAPLHVLLRVGNIGGERGLHEVRPIQDVDSRIGHLDHEEVFPAIELHAHRTDPRHQVSLGVQNEAEPTFRAGSSG